MRNRILGFIQSIRIVDDLLLYNLIGDVDMNRPIIEERLIRAMLARPEHEDAAQIFALLPPDAERARRAYLASGFEPLDLDAIFDIREELNIRIKKTFPEWKPFQEITVCLRYVRAI